MPKKIIYTALNYDHEDSVLDGSLAFVQAAKALDQAGSRAVQSEDTEALTNIAALWIKMGESLGVEEENEEKSAEGRQPAGFALAVVHSEDEGELEIVEPDGDD